MLSKAYSVRCHNKKVLNFDFKLRKEVSDRYIFKPAKESTLTFIFANNNQIKASRKVAPFSMLQKELTIQVQQNI